jgi:hypothetical protein
LITEFWSNYLGPLSSFKFYVLKIQKHNILLEAICGAVNIEVGVMLFLKVTLRLLLMLYMQIKEVIQGLVPLFRPLS